ncbi:restriction endonuclease subunit S [Companilactobacillus sp.]|uniref:restriction endonuclease subunit S n=1 Tax=Companilactobacillus sp. TaxID=2767905 RepID=UPI0026194FCB|nr:restriction endonuclease subunit S [Companilactobacillus sp.]
MKDKQAKYPQLRFKGFTDPWVQRKLGEVADIIGGGTPSTNVSEYWNGDIDWYSPVEIGNQIYIDESQKKITGLGLQKSSAHILPVGTVLFTSRAGIGNTAILAKEGCTNQGFQSIVPYKDLLNSYFIFSRTSELKHYGEINGAGSTFIEVSGKQMAKMPISVPSIEEQQKIGTFFKQLDDTITLHQRKLDLLKKQKKGYLQKMLPQNGSKFPQLRFAGFADDWEERKVSELADRYDNLRVPITASERVAGETPYYGANGIQDYVEGFTHNGEFVLVTEDGANDLQNYPVKYVDGKVWVNNHAHVLQAKEERVDNKFLTNALKHTNIEPYLVGGGRAKLNADVMMKINFKVPTLPEQVQIGKFFDNLDHLITLHQRKLDLLKEQKKGFLQNMFV